MEHYNRKQPQSSSAFNAVRQENCGLRYSSLAIVCLELIALNVRATVYAGSSQATQAGDALLIEVLRADNSVLAGTTNAPGAWTGKMTFTPASFQYKGDGSGDVRLRIGPAGTMNSGRFHGAIDNIMVKEMK